jgi:thioredoxin 1
MTILKNTTDISEFLASDENVVIDFFADWCGPCKALTPKLEELSKQYEGIIAFAKFNVEDDEDDALSGMAIRNLPTLLFYKNGEVIDKVVGGRPISDIANKISELYSAAS